MHTHRFPSRTKQEKWHRNGGKRAACTRTHTQTNIYTQICTCLNLHGLKSVFTVWLWLFLRSTEWQGKRERERGMSPAGGTEIEAKSTKEEIDRGREIQRGQVYIEKRRLQIKTVTLWGTLVIKFNSFQGFDTIKTLVSGWKPPGGCDLMQSQSTPCSSGSWLRSASPAEVLMLLGLEQAGRGPSYQKWALPRGTATDPCYWLWQSHHSGCLRAFHTHVGGTATHPNLTQLELIPWRGDDG